MAKDQTDRINIFSEDIESENLNKLKSIFPQFVKDGQVDFDSLQEFFNKEGISSGTEKYGLSWNGKSNAFKAIRLPSTGTLNPQKEESKNWDNTKNIFIEGDNLEVLKLLQKHYREKIKMIYIDPPYNTGKDFVYKDNFTQSVADYYEQTGQTKDGIKMTANTEKNGRYHSDWLTMMYPRLFLAKNLLKDDGVIFVSIDDNEVANLRLIMDEIFGEDNFVSVVTRIAKRTSDKGTYFRPTKDYILVYAKNIQELSEFGVKKDIDENDYKLIDEDGKKYKQSGASLYQPSLDSRPNQRYYIEAPDGSLIIPPGDVFPNIKEDGSKIKPLSNNDKVWRWSLDTYLKQKHLLIFTKGSTQNPLLDENGNQSKWNIYPKVFFDDDISSSLHPEDVIYNFPNSQSTKELNDLDIPFTFAKPTGLIKYLLRLTTIRDDIVLDFFAGSGTTAHAVMDLNSEDEGNRKWICVQLPEETDEKSEAYKAGYRTISQIARERIRRAGEFLKDNKADLPLKVDLGFKAYTLSKSNYRIWNELSADSDTKDIIEQSKLFIDKPLVDKYDEISVVNEILLKEGFSLNSIIESIKDLDTFDYFKVSDEFLERKIIVTFAKKVTKEQVEQLGLTEQDIFVCFDSALDDTTKVNIGRNINLKVI